MLNNKRLAKEKALKKLGYLTKIKEIENLSKFSHLEKEKLLQECFKRVGIPIPKYKNFMSKENFFNFNKEDILTFRLIDTPILKDLGIYLIGIGESLYIAYYSEEKKTFVIDDNKVIPKSKATIEGILAKVEEGGN